MASNRSKLLALLVLALLLTTQAFAAEDGNPSTNSATNTATGDIDPEMLKQAKAERKAAAKKKKLTMKSCLTLVRSFYAKEDEFVQNFMEVHPTTDKNRLLSKILSQMMIKCNGAISDDQINYLQKFKLNALDMDHKEAGYADLILIDWEDLQYQPMNPDEGLVEGEG